MTLIHALIAAAPGPAAAEQAASAAEVNSIWEFILKGGPMMIPIGLASIVAFAVGLERIINLTRARVAPPAFLPGLQSALGERDDRNAALAYCKNDPSPMARVFESAIRRLDEPTELLEQHIEDAGQRVMFGLRARLRALAVVASVTPLLGLLGTILGMIQAFQTVSTSGEALGKTELLAGGIYEAMITTAAGLCVAIPTLIVYHWIQGKVERLVLLIDAQTLEFVESRRAGSISAPATEPDAQTDVPNAALATG